MRLAQISEFLHLTEQEVLRMVQREGLPAHKVAGEWRFRKDEVFQWLGDRYLPEMTEERWRRIEGGRARMTSLDPTRAIVSSHIPEGGIAVGMASKTKASVLRDLVKLAEETGALYDAEGVASGLVERERQGPTALGGGVAFPHPQAPVPYAAEDSLVVLGVTAQGIPFGAPDGGLTDVFFLVVAKDASSHLHLLARLGRMMAEGNLVERLRACETPEEAREVVLEAELEVAAGL